MNRQEAVSEIEGCIIRLNRNVDILTVADDLEAIVVEMRLPRIPGEDLG